MRHPGPISDEPLCRRHLLRVISCHEPHQNVGVNGAHNVPLYVAVSPPSSPQASEPSAVWGTAPDADLPMCIDPHVERQSSPRLRPIPEWNPGQYRAFVVPQQAPKSAPEP